MGVQSKYSESTIEVQCEYSASTVEVQSKYSGSTVEVQWEYRGVQWGYALQDSRFLPRESNSSQGPLVYDIIL